MNKTLSFFKNNQTCEVEIRLHDGRLSICGTVYEGKRLRSDERNLISCGQCIDWAKEFIPARLYEIWDRWHLNNMRAGTPAQEQYLREQNEYIVSFGGKPMDYGSACECLAAKDLLVDNGHKYGSAWLKEDLPQEVIDYVSSL